MFFFLFLFFGPGRGVFLAWYHKTSCASMIGGAHPLPYQSPLFPPPTLNDSCFFSLCAAADRGASGKGR